VPYIGTRPFRTSDSAIFFGRQREAREIATQWLTRRVVLLQGDAAIGKTSVLAAGVLPLVRGEKTVHLLPVARLSRHPVSHPVGLRGGNHYRQALLSSWWTRPEQPLSELTISEFFARVLSAEHEPRAGVLAAIDQVEELFADLPGRDDQRDQLMDELGVALREHPSLRLLLVVRADYVIALRSYQHLLADNPWRCLQLGPLDSEAALDAVMGPLARTGRSFGAGVAEHLVEMLRTVRYTDQRDRTLTVQADRVHPLALQVVCAHLWSSLPAKVDYITDEHLLSAGEPEQALADFYDAAIREISQWTSHVEIGELELRDWVEFTFITEMGTRGAVARGLATTADMPNRIADAFTDLNLLAPEYRNNGMWYQLIEDGMINAIRLANGAWRAAHNAEALRPARPRSAAEYRAAAKTAAELGDLPAAYRLFEIAADSYRCAGEMWDLAATLELQGKIARENGDLAGAQQSYGSALFEYTILEDTPGQVRLLSVLGDIYTDLQDYVKAVQFHQLASERLPTDVDALTGLGYAQWLWGSPADADVTFTKALNWDRNQGQALAGRGQVRVELREYPAALDDLDRALTLRLPPDTEIDARSARAVALADLGREDEADRELKTARLKDPGRPRTRLRAARVAAATGQLAIARDELTAAMHAQPPLPPTDEDYAKQLLTELTAKV
jgi:tetratricopeptide (TPR) repeat protein